MGALPELFVDHKRESVHFNRRNFPSWNCGYLQYHSYCRWCKYRLQRHCEHKHFLQWHRIEYEHRVLLSLSGWCCSTYRQRTIICLDCKSCYTVEPIRLLPPNPVTPTVTTTFTVTGTTAVARKSSHMVTVNAKPVAVAARLLHFADAIRLSEWNRKYSGNDVFMDKRDWLHRDFTVIWILPPMFVAMICLLSELPTLLQDVSKDSAVSATARP